jgi:hypothetical protein
MHEKTQSVFWESPIFLEKKRWIGPKDRQEKEEGRSMCNNKDP